MYDLRHIVDIGQQNAPPPRQIGKRPCVKHSERWTGRPAQPEISSSIRGRILGWASPQFSSLFLSRKKTPVWISFFQACEHPSAQPPDATP